MKKLLIILFMLIASVSYGQFGFSKYLVVSDTILTFTSPYDQFQITILDSAVVDTVVLEKANIGLNAGAGWSTVAIISMATGSYVTSMIPGAGANGVIYFVRENGQGYFRLRMTDTAGDASTKSVKVNVSK